MSIAKFLSVHPGELLREECSKPMGITAYRLAQATPLPPPRINQLLHEKRGLAVATRVEDATRRQNRREPKGSDLFITEGTESRRIQRE